MKFEIWVEGYSALGNKNIASFIGSVEAKSFEEACIKKCSSKRFQANYGTFDSNNLSLWGCRLFPSEYLARKSFS